LVEGASGTGKELVARAIHHNSSRKNGPFIAVNCSAIPENLLESELFGHTKGAYTGAVDAQKGVFEQAHGGTLLLDEIAEMPYNLQSKLLRVIEDWEVKPLGSDKVRKVDIRLISSTNQNLSEFIASKKFREDLYYRISTVNVYLPPLNERKEDIPLLVNHFLKRNSDKLNRNLSIEPGAVELLVEYDCKGNVRELENVIERAVISANDDKLRKSHFRFLGGGQPNNGGLGAVENAELKDVERMYIKKVLEENGWNKLKAARVLGIDRKTLYNKIKEFGLE
jgi:transcriptional regulator with PAS, ATPase and Fis domain